MKSLLVACLLVVCGCHSMQPSSFWFRPEAPTDTQLRRLSERMPEIPPGDAWVAAPSRIERALLGSLEVRSGRDVEHGQTRTARLTVYSAATDLEFEVKWKPAKPRLQGVNNSPRREIAAYVIQKLVLEPEGYVVPTTGLHCLEPGATPGLWVGERNLDGVSCVVGAASLWLQNVRYPVKRIDWDRFLSDPIYAHHAANMNVAAILMDHSDTHTRNMLVSQDAKNRRMFLIDNGIAFNSVFRSPFSRDWNRVRVPALRRPTYQRVASLRRSDLDVLATVGELRRSEDGRFRPVEPGEPIDPRRPVRVGEDVIQVGLKQSEIDAAWQRVLRLRREVESGRVRLF